MRPTISLALFLAALSAPTAAHAGEDDVNGAPIFRVALGPAFHLSPPPSRAVSQFAIDVTAGVGFGGNPTKSTFRFMPELGYSYDHLGIHLFSVSAGVGVGDAMFSFLYHPRFLLGSWGSDTAIGLRNSLVMHFFLDSYSLELGVQNVFAGGRSQGDFRVMFGMNPLALMPWIPLFMGVGRAFTWMSR
jgi:hypothetical protein